MISAPVERDRIASVPGISRRLSANSTATRGPAPQRPHCQTSTFIAARARPVARRASASGPRPSRSRGREPPARAQCRARFRIVGEPAQGGNRLALVRLGPDRARRLEHAARVAGGHQAIADQARALRVHEVHVAGPAGGDDGTPEQHRLGGDQPESLAAMEREHDVGGGGQRVAVAGRQDAGVDPDVRRIRDSRRATCGNPPGKSAGLPIFKTRTRSARPSNASRNAATAWSGFLRSNEEARLNETSTTTAFPGSPKAARSRAEGSGGAAASGGGTTRTRPGNSVSIAEAVKRDSTQTSCTKAAPARQSSGTEGEFPGPVADQAPLAQRRTGQPEQRERE